MKEISKKINSVNFKIKLAGDNGFHLIPISEHDVQSIINVYHRIKPIKLLGVIDIIPSLVNILIVFDRSMTSFETIVNEIIELLKNKKIYQNKQNYLWEIPVCYDREFAKDINYVSEMCKIKPCEVFKIHSEKIYTVKMMGFLPGLPFMGDLNNKLYLPRKAEPRLRVPSGSVGIAMNQTVIYPQESPGGWNLIGRIPVNIFERRKKKAILFSVGDKVKFKDIPIKDFEKIFNKNLIRPYELKKTKIQ